MRDHSYMNNLSILIPFGLPPKEYAPIIWETLSKQLPTKGLATLLSRGQHTIHTDYQDLTTHLPHEAWLDNWLSAHDTSWLAYQAHHLHTPLSTGCWFLLTPVFFQLHATHGTLTDPTNLSLTEETARVLFDIAQALCAEEGITLVYGNPTTWFLRADDWHDLSTTTPAAACGRHAIYYTPQGEHELAWKKLHNAIQMAWFNHPIQDTLLKHHHRVNGLWLHAKTNLSQTTSLTSYQLPLFLNPPYINACTERSTAPPLIILDTLERAALAQEWDEWMKQMIELEKTWFYPLYMQLKKGAFPPYQGDQIRLYLSNHDTLLGITITRLELYRFWRKISLYASLHLAYP